MGALTICESLATTHNVQKAVVEVWKNSYCEKANDAEFAAFVSICGKFGLAPERKQIYFAQIKGKATIIVGIDGFRLIASREANYVGSSTPEYCGEDGLWTECWVGKGLPIACRVGIYNKGFDKPTYGIVHTKEFKGSSANWNSMPLHMLAVRAEVFGLKKLFPGSLGGLEVDSSDGGGNIKVSGGKQESGYDMDPLITPQQEVAFFKALESSEDVTEKYMKDSLKAKFGVTQVDQLTISQYQKVMAYLVPSTIETVEGTVE